MNIDGIKAQCARVLAGSNSTAKALASFVLDELDTPDPPSLVTGELLQALKDLYALVPDCDGDYLLDGNVGEFALKAIRVPGIGEACKQAREAISRAESAGVERPRGEKQA